MNVYTYTPHTLHKSSFLTVLLVGTLNPSELRREKNPHLRNPKSGGQTGKSWPRAEKAGVAVTGPHNVLGSLSTPAVLLLLSLFLQDQEKQNDEK